ncbi:hypothetical protein [Paracidovorax citrulli]|uniref:hypothetical protein n=1 Tax=Paracidovorax citrulli TaxID=80869 RepID=UPI0005FB11E2|nr:hypothetical protein [Paracidovorax citrulli]
MPTKTAGGLVKFDPTINTGTIIQTLVFVGSVAVAYGAYREDQTRQDGRIAQIESTAAQERETTRAYLAEIKAEQRDQAKTLGDLKEGVAILRGRAAEPGVRK